jgi:hypothetical protein
VPFEYEKVSRKEFDGGIIMVTKEGKEFLIDKTGQAMKPSPEPYESAFKNASKLANNSTERAKAIIDYEKGLQSLKYTDGQILYLLSQKYTQAVETDYYCVFQALMKCDRQRVQIFNKASFAMTEAQRAGIKALTQYTIDEFVANQNNKQVPSYPAGIPKPGFGWGKSVTSDRVVYQPSVTSSTNINTSPKAPLVSESQAKYLTGQYFTYSKRSDSYNRFDPFAKEYANYALKVIGLSEKSTPENPMLKIRYTNNDGSYCYAYTGEIDATDLVYGHDNIIYLKWDGYDACTNCGGAGRWSGSYSHTNDYQYTYGVEVTYSGTYSKSCKSCGGSGKGKYKSYRIDCL